MCSPRIVAWRLRKKSRPFRPISSKLTCAAERSCTKRCAPLMRLVLNAPARPLSPVISTSRIRRSSRRASKGFSATRSSPAAAAATLPSTLRSIPAYGRDARVRSCARRSLAAETIFMALVICCVFLTERMRRRISMRLGICLYRRGHFADEADLELLDRTPHLGFQFLVQRLLGLDFLEDSRVGALHESIQAFFELAALLDREIVEISLGARVDDHDLLFERERMILALLEDL